MQGVAEGMPKQKGRKPLPNPLRDLIEQRRNLERTGQHSLRKEVSNHIKRAFFRHQRDNIRMAVIEAERTGGNQWNTCRNMSITRQQPIATLQRRNEGVTGPKDILQTMKEYIGELYESPTGSYERMNTVKKKGWKAKPSVKKTSCKLSPTSKARQQEMRRDLTTDA